MATAIMVSPTSTQKTPNHLSCDGGAPRTAAVAPRSRTTLDGTKHVL